MTSTDAANRPAPAVAESTRSSLRPLGIRSSKSHLNDEDIREVCSSLLNELKALYPLSVAVYSDSRQAWSSFGPLCKIYRESEGCETCDKFCSSLIKSKASRSLCPAGLLCRHVSMKTNLGNNLAMIAGGGLPSKPSLEAKALLDATGIKVARPAALDSKRRVKLYASALSARLELECARREISRLDTVMETTCELSEILTTAHDKKKVLEAILAIGIKMCGADTGAIMLIDDDRNLRIEIAHTKRPFDPRRISIPWGQGLTGLAASTGKIMNIPDVASDERFIQSPDHVGSELIIPLNVKGRVIGVLNFESGQLNAFAQEHEVTLGMLALHVASLIENAELYTRIEQKLNEISILFQVNKAISSTLDIEKLFPLIVRLIKDVMGVETLSLMLLDPVKKALYVKECDGIPEEIARSACVPVGEGISGWVAQHGRPLLIPDVNDHPVSKSRISCLPRNTRSALSVPLAAHGRTIGVINVNNKKSGEVFTLEDQILLEMMAIQVTAAIENARLYEETRRQVSQLSAINEVGRYISSSLDSRVVLTGVVDTIMLLIPSDSASLMIAGHDGQLRAEIVRGIDESYFSAVQEDLNKGVAGLVIKGRNAMLIDDTSRSPEYIKTDDELPKTMLCAPLVARDKVVGVISLERELLGDARPFTEEQLSLLTILTSQAAVSIENASLYENLLNVYLETVQSLAAAIEAKDSYTSGHSKRVSIYAVAIAEQMGIDEDELKTLKHTALLHDIGKIGISKQILEKPTPLSGEEWNNIRDHPSVGAEILKSVAFLKDVGEQLKHHHERFDGTGYPDGLKGDEIPVGSRVIAVADTFDAMTSTRPYRRGLAADVAFTEIERCSGAQFDPLVVDAFLAIREKITELLNSPVEMEA